MPLPWKKIIVFGLIAFSAGLLLIAAALFKFAHDLPELITVEDYKPLLVSEVFDRNGKKIGEFTREKRILTPYEKFPKSVIDAFVAAEDDTFFTHSGLNYLAIARSTFANIRAGRKAQGGSTITQQVARSLLLSSEKTYSRKIKEIMLSFKMEKHLKKQDILYLYLNQIFLGQGAYGVGAAAQVYFRKNVADLTVPEAAILAGLPQAPSRYSPIQNPMAAKDRQRYVLRRMAETGVITKAEAEKYAEQPVKLYVWQSYKELAPYYLETVRQMLVQELGEETVLDKGIKIYTGLDLDKQKSAQEAVQIGLRALDKRQGFRGPEKNLTDPQQVAEFLVEVRNDLMDEASPERILLPNGTYSPRGPLNLSGKDEQGQPLPNLPNYIPLQKIVRGVVTKVDDTLGLVYVRFAESKGLIDIDSMSWARAPDPNLRAEEAMIKKPSQALKTGDVIEVKVVEKAFRSDRLDKLVFDLKKAKKTAALETVPSRADYAELELEQTPNAEAALLSLDQTTGDIVAMVGGYDFARSKYNRAIQAQRQTGSSFKAIVYASALDKGYNPTTPIIDAPIVYEETVDEGQDVDKNGQPETKIWKPKNDSNKFGGDILFRNALIRSLNVPTVKIIEKIGVDWAATYARRLGIFSPLNMDFTLALGSSGVTLYEMTRAFSTIGRLGKRMTPLLVEKVVDHDGNTILEKLSLDKRFQAQIAAIEDDFENRRQEYLRNPEAAEKQPPVFFEDKDQLLKPSTAYVMTTIMQGVIDDAHGTGGSARSLGRPVAGKTGSTSGFYDGWFVGFTADVSTGVWVGYDEEKTLGRGEVGARTALPIWLEYMKAAHENLPPRPFPVPDGVVFANIDSDTGRLVSAGSKTVVRQAFLDGTEPGSANNPETKEEDQNFYKEDMAQ